MNVAHIKTRLYQLGAIYASMTGSGSAVYGLFTTTTPTPNLWHTQLPLSPNLP